MKYTVYDQASGRITRWGDCEAADIDHQAGSGQGVIAGMHASPADSKVVDGAVVDMSESERAAYAAQRAG
ncbi:MAG: hypothetical protein AB7I35_12340 [Ramlibacter sp.]